MTDAISSFWRWIKKKVCGSYDAESEEILVLKESLGQCEADLETQKQINKELEERNDSLIEDIEEASETIQFLRENQKEETDELEIYWNNKRPKNDKLTYPGRPLFTNINTKCWIDPRIYFNTDSTVPIISGGSHDEIAIKSLDYVKQRTTYKSDKDPSEFWQFAFETKQRRQGDCEDGAILLANILLASGVPYWRVRLNAGDVEGGGHAYVTYLAEKDNQWYILDWCYWYDKSKNLQRTFHDAEKYFGIWFSWNKNHIYPNDELDRETLKNKGVLI